MTVAVLAVGLLLPAAARADDNVQVYTNQVLPVPPPLSQGYYNSPLSAGQLTLQDVLEAHPKKPVPPPLLSPSSNVSSQGVMLLQGMQSALQEAPPAGQTQRLRAPQMQTASAPGSVTAPSASAMAALTAPVETPTVTASGVQYQPGEAPRNLAALTVPAGTEQPSAPPVATASGVFGAPASETPEVSASSDTAIISGPGAPAMAAQEMQPAEETAPIASPASPVSAPTASIFGAPVSETPEMASVSTPTVSASAAQAAPLASSGSGACEPHVASWTKSCLEAGYPASYTGKILGETRTVCPAGDLQDVWIENSCTPPPEGAASSPNVSPGAMAAASEAAAPMMPSSAANLSSQPMMASETVRADGNCGPASGLAASARPSGDLCAFGTPTEVGGDGPWRWNCNGIAGGMTVSCAAPVATSGVAGGMPAAAPVAAPSPTSYSASAAPALVVENGQCGAADGVGTDQPPPANLCAKGAASRVNGEGPWTWACSGMNGGQAAACAAPRIVSGLCGAAASRGTSQMPMTDLCAAGYASAVTGNGPWNWTCSGLYGGGAAVCAAIPKRDAVCGTATLGGRREAPADNLCSIGQPSAVGGQGPWNWTCSGLNGGAPASCMTAVSVSGTCGTANGVAATIAPGDNLCLRGQPTRVSGTGPWVWNCTGLQGGDTGSCVAPLAAPEEMTKPNAPGVAAPVEEEPAVAAPLPAAPPVPAQNAVDMSGMTPPPPASAPVSAVMATKTEMAPSPVACGMAAEAAAVVAPTRDLCNGGSAGNVSGNGPWTWNCTDNTGHGVDCSTLAPADGKCGVAGDTASAQMPAAHLCASGIAGTVSSDKAQWTWTCAGTLGGASAFCTAPIAPLTSVTPSAAAMMPPAASSVTTSVSAPTQAPAPAPVPAAAAPASTAAPAPTEAICGSADQQGYTSEPSADSLCAIGKASRVIGKGPWHWTCAYGKTKASCEAMKTVDGACGTANGSIQKSAPEKNLCAGGSASVIAGHGPWLWSCVGSGGGGSASCSATSQAQTRVDGACGAAGNVQVTSAPSSNLCDGGMASNVYGDGPWTWTCSGLNGGVATSCSAQKVMPPAPPPPGPTVNGLCGSANGVASVVQPTDDLCTTGTVTVISGQGPWNWNCIGQNGGMTVSCTAPLEPPAPITGACGSASGVPTLVTPRSGLCAAGISSAVSGSGPWTWSCSGTNGGGAVACVAPLAGGGTGSLPSFVTPSGMTAPGAPAGAAPMYASPSPQNTGLVTPQLPSGTLPPIETGNMPQMPPTQAFPAAPEATSAPEALPPATPQFAPVEAPELPDAAPLTPPPVRDTIQPSPALTAPAVNGLGQPIPGNHFVLSDDISSISFAAGSENISPAATPALDKLANILQANGDVRITLTAYAAVGPNTTPRDARRLSLARALAIRDYLTTKGVSSGRIDVRALGANVPSGDMDRVDVKAN